MKTTSARRFSNPLLTGVLGLAAYSILCGAPALWAGTEPGYSHDGGVQVFHQDWMSKLPNSFKLSYMSLPGAHDTMALAGGDAVQTQSMSLQNQLDSGIRALDIRIGFYKDTFYLTHSFVPQAGTFEGVVETVVRFLMYHPTETILMRVKKDYDYGQNTKSFEQVFLGFWNGYMSPYFWRGTDRNPTLSEIRSRIVVLQDFSADGSYGIPYNSFATQDNYNLKDNWDLYNKWSDVKSQLVLSRSVGTVAVPKGGLIYYPPNAYTLITSSGSYVSFSDPLEDVRFMNYLSGATGSFPYFVASGKSSPATSAPRLATGRTSPGWSAWPDFPRVDCFVGICTIAFEGTNNLTYDWLGDNNPKRVGIIMADFPGPGLIERIIEVNYRLVQSGF